MSIATEITRLQNAKSALKSAIENKGVTVPSSTKLDGYASLVSSIPSGGGIEGDIMNPNSIYVSFYQIDPYVMDAPFWGCKTGGARDMVGTWASGDPFELQFLAKLGDSYSIVTSGIKNLDVSPQTISGTFTQSDEVTDEGNSFDPKRYDKEIYPSLSLIDSSKPAIMMVSVTIGSLSRNVRIILVEYNSWN